MRASPWPLALIFATSSHAAALSARPALTGPPHASVRRSPRFSPCRAPPAVLQEGGGLPDLGLNRLWSRLSGTVNQVEEDRQIALANAPDPNEDVEFVPLVLVVGATGRTGRIIVRKLVLRGFRVAVLVRSLSSDTLNLLGSGVSYSYGDMTDYQTLLDAMEDVDKVIFCAGDSENHARELEGLKAVLRAFQDTRTFMYGEAEATKLTLFKLRKDADFAQWQVESSGDDIAQRLAEAGIGQQPAIAYWKRSPEGLHSNGVFVGRVFDTYLGSASISCGLRGKPRPLARLLPSEDNPLGAPEPELQHEEVAEGLTALDLGEYSGITIKAIGDGNVYTATIRTNAFESDGVEYQANFHAPMSTFSTARLPFSSFLPYRKGRRLSAADAPELDRRNIVGLALSFFPFRNDPEKTTGKFYLSVAHIKAYRKRDEPELVYLSDAGVGRHWRRQMTDAVLSSASANSTAVYSDASNATAAAPPTDGGVTVQERVQVKLQGEDLLRRSGLTYFIVRPSELEDRPGGGNIKISQDLADDAVMKKVSRTDVAEVIVSSLLDPRACNVACTLTSSEYAKVGPAQDISKMLEVMQPNRM
ncbi:hypothetical protein AB1Y20_016548 [Prymnesium parvum]|uniref:NAD(P)-binding domain-containing protein n=1 Tax=Prymnesium parvum TaxID=97485 RepID=A0AB34IA52_PRYPA